MTMSLLKNTMARRIFAVCLAFLMTHDLVQASGVGQRFSLTAPLQLATGQSAQVFVPDYYVAPTNSKVMLVFHLHGGVGTSEDMVYKPRANAVVFSLQLNGLSGVYKTYFSDTAKFPMITNLVMDVLRTNSIVANPQIGKLVMTSFSAGYAGIREMLKVPANYQRIDALMLGDTLYSSSDPASRAVDMQHFLQFAVDARDLNKFFLLTHSSVATSGYDSTVQTADYLVSGIGRSWSSTSVVDTIGTQYRQCDAGQFQAKGYLGNSGSDHSKHYQNMNFMMERLIELMAITNIVPETELRFTSVSRLSNNQVQLGLLGTPGTESFVERSTDFTNWKPVSIITANTNPITLLDSLVENENRFYQARLATVQTISPFESYSSGAVVMFQSPSYSGSTSGFLDLSSPAFGYVTNVFPAGGSNNARVFQANWSFKADQVNPWVRLTTFNAVNLPNPIISLTGALRFDIYSSRDIYVALGVRETDATAPFGANGGTVGGIEWIGGSTQNSAPPLGRFVPAGSWARLVFFIPHEPISSFVGNGVLNSTTGRGTLEHLALVPADGAGAYTIYLDNLQVIE